jgi:hypothetical protein
MSLKPPFNLNGCTGKSKAIASHPFNTLPLLKRARETTPSRSKEPIGANDNNPLGWREDHVPEKRIPFPCRRLDVFPEAKGSTKEESKAQTPMFKPLARTKPSNPIPEQRDPTGNRFSRTRRYLLTQNPHFEAEGLLGRQSNSSPPFGALSVKESLNIKPVQINGPVTALLHLVTHPKQRVY